MLSVIQSLKTLAIFLAAITPIPIAPASPKKLVLLLLFAFVDFSVAVLTFLIFVGNFEKEFETVLRLLARGERELLSLLICDVNLSTSTSLRVFSRAGNFCN